MRTALLLCALLVLVGCAALATPTPAPYTAEEAAYLTGIASRLDVLPAALRSAATNVLPISAAATPQAWLTQIHEAEAPATLAVVAHAADALYTACNTPLVQHPGAALANHPTPCREALDALRLELARLYAARGAYPPGFAP